MGRVEDGEGRGLAGADAFGAALGASTAEAVAGSGGAPLVVGPLGAEAWITGCVLTAQGAVGASAEPAELGPRSLRSTAGTAATRPRTNSAASAIAHLGMRRAPARPLSGEPSPAALGRDMGGGVPLPESGVVSRMDAGGAPLTETGAGGTPLMDPGAGGMPLTETGAGGAPRAETGIGSGDIRSPAGGAGASEPRSLGNVARTARNASISSGTVE